MLGRVASSRRCCWQIAFALLVLLSFARGASAQLGPGDSVPSRIYFAALPSYYDGAYRDAAATFLNTQGGGFKAGGGRWIDSICYFTMAGECYYQLGQLPQALESYNSALKVYIAYSDWMMRIQFPPGITPATTGVMRAAPWGQSRRGARVGQFSETYLIGQGQVDQSQVVARGGVLQAPMMFPVHVAEIVRCTSLAIRRRKELLGPLSKFDPLTTDVLDVLARKPGPPNHWSEAWMSVQLGCAYSAAGNAAQANAALQRGLLVAGEFDHPLASTALLEIGKLALEAGDFTLAATSFEEATFSCVNFPNPGNLEEAFRLRLLAHTLLNQRGPFGPLVPAMAWAKTQGYRQLQSSLVLSAAENMLLGGSTAEGASLLGTARGLLGRGDLANSQSAARLNHLTALAAYQAGNVPDGDQAIAAALNFQRNGSLWNFRIGLSDSRYLSGNFSDRTALALFDILLRDPAPADWTVHPLECLSMLSTPHPAALEHWFELAAKNKRDPELAMEVADLARRHRFFSTLPMGGRLLALRWILEGPLELLGQRGLLQRQDLLARYPRYAELADQAAKVRGRLAGKPLVEDTVDARREQAADLAALGEISQSQEVILREIAVRREPAEMVFPPVRTTKEVQQGLADGQVLLSFFGTTRNMHAFLYGKDKYASWTIQSPSVLQKQVGNLLREAGNFDANHEISAADLAKQSWRTTASKVMHLLLDKSNVDLAGNFDEIVIVPDGPLWYLPFEALPVGKGDQQKPLISRARVRYAPTVGLALPYQTRHKPRPAVGVALGKLFPRDDDTVAQTAFEQMARSVEGAVALPRALPAATGVYRTLIDELIVLDDIKPADGAYDWTPAPDRGRPAALSNWLTLPWGGPEYVILPGYHTAAESGLRRGQATGNDLFLPLCGLMASGVRTVLISRWRPGGQTGFDLVREFAQELPHTSPAEAWQRSVQVAANTPLEPEREPRVKKGSAHGDPPNAEHPFFWSAYLLADSGVVPPGEDKSLSLPGLEGQKKAPAANPGVVPANPPAGVPANPPGGNFGALRPPVPDSELAPDDEPAPPTKRAKKAKPAPRTPTKKPSAKKAAI